MASVQRSAPLSRITTSFVGSKERARKAPVAIRAASPQANLYEIKGIQEAKPMDLQIRSSFSLELQDQGGTPKSVEIALCNRENKVCYLGEAWFGADVLLYDGNTIVRGRSEFDVLDSFGVPDAGCNVLLYRTPAKGKWRRL